MANDPIKARVAPSPGRAARPDGEGYREWECFRAATALCDGVFFFCRDFVEPQSERGRQLSESARALRVEIVQSSLARSAHDALRFILAAQARAVELLLDFEDQLRREREPQWTSDAPEAQSALANATPWLEHTSPATRANALICLARHTALLLNRQAAADELRLAEEGAHRFAGDRAARRNRKKGASAAEPVALEDPAHPESYTPDCPLCGEAMILRVAKTGRSAGQQFWGCSQYPQCKGVVSI
ncbi:MAG: topoisomerase DNA-binding C4 zinc finger domain-containing protein [Kiritimatiellae bacterium]|nr:topoisomerase DNA-binding C4 zinc finger domain-containing protein [Kiritimatiellia bacterium]